MKLVRLPQEIVQWQIVFKIISVSLKMFALLACLVWIVTQPSQTALLRLRTVKEKIRPAQRSTASGIHNVGRIALTL